ncbi:MAG TPA: hypothetical protein VGF30_01590 [Bacteroidia bacterium]
MYKPIEFEITDPTQVVEKTIHFFTRSEFKLVEQNGNNLKFKKGSILRNGFTFDPLKWKSDLTVEITGNKIKAKLDIANTGQSMGNKEEEVLDSFFKSYKLYVNEGLDFEKAHADAAQKIKKHGWNIVLWAVLGAVVIGVPAGIIAYLTGIKSILTTGAIFGAILGMLKVQAGKKPKDL